MKAIMVMYDTLTRDFLQPYGYDWVKTPNFKRLAQRAVTFDTCYAGSMPCMPARRELHTGRYNFLHRSWGPLEPFDDSMPQILRENGIYSHLVSDHQHYWEDGGATYHTRYESWECSRGQEGDPWKARIGTRRAETVFTKTSPSEPLGMRLETHDAMNRAHIGTDHRKMPQDVTFSAGLDFIDANHAVDDWFLQIETFDPHEPFFTQQAFRDLYPDDYRGPDCDWPPYDVVLQGDDTVKHVRNLYASLITMCDSYLGRVLDKMDEYDLWNDTMLIVNTDHGFLLGEHGWWGKTIMPMYNEIVHTPLFIYDPRSMAQGERRKSLVQTIDLPATLLEYFGLPLPEDMEGRSLRPVIERDEAIREYGMYGMHASYVCITDGRYTYLRAPIAMDNQPCFEYTLMPAHMRDLFGVGELMGAELHKPFPFTKGCPVLQIPVDHFECNGAIYGSKLFDVQADPGQLHELDDPANEARLARALVCCMKENCAPVEQFERLGLSQNEGDISEESVLADRKALEQARKPVVLQDVSWEVGAQNCFWTLLNMTAPDRRPFVREGFERWMRGKSANAVSAQDVQAFMHEVVDEGQWDMMDYFMRLVGRDH